MQITFESLLEENLKTALCDREDMPEQEPSAGNIQLVPRVRKRTAANPRKHATTAKSAALALTYGSQFTNGLVPDWTKTLACLFSLIG